MSGDGETLTVERARRELRRLVALRDGELNRVLTGRHGVWGRLTWWDVIAISSLPDLMQCPCCFGRGKRLRTRFERLQRLEKLIEEREDELVASSLRLRVHPATHKGLD